MRQISSPPGFAPFVEPDHLGNIVVTPIGDLDIATSPELVGAIRQAVSDLPKRVVIDLGSVTFLDSWGCTALVVGCRDAHSSGVLLRLEGSMAPIVERVLSITGLRAIFDPAPTAPPLRTLPATHCDGQWRARLGVARRREVGA